jgi:manganese/zinc/iron transport system substrate-binding protein
VLWNGWYLEAQMEEFLLELGEQKPVVAVAEALPENLLIGSEDYEGRFDPHIWMNPNLWAQPSIATRDALIEVHPEGAETFTANADAYLAQLARACALHDRGADHRAGGKPRPPVAPMTPSTISATPMATR